MNKRTFRKLAIACLLNSRAEQQYTEQARNEPINVETDGSLNLRIYRDGKRQLGSNYMTFRYDAARRRMEACTYEQ